jgi:hypothetical protein
MTPVNLIIDVFLYFARFPAKDGVLKLFNKGRSDIPGYDALMLAVSELPEHSLFQDVGAYVFGNNEDAVKKCIDGISGFYLFVDYGDIESGRDQINRVTDSFYIAVTIAFPLSDFSGDLADQVLISNQALEYILELRRYMIVGQKEKPWMKDIADNHEITPFVARELNGSIGWTMTFSRQGFDILKGK